MQTASKPSQGVNCGAGACSTNIAPAKVQAIMMLNSRFKSGPVGLDDSYPGVSKCAFGLKCYIKAVGLDPAARAHLSHGTVPELLLSYAS